MQVRVALVLVSSFTSPQLFSRAFIASVTAPAP
jgi:hypothetical protein